MTGAAVALGGGGGFIGRAVTEALGRARVVAFGREGISEATCPEVHVLIWAGGGRDGGEEAHVAAPLRALAVAAARGARRVVYVSSGEVYGVQPVPFNEDAQRLGDTAYARAKIRGEDEVRAAAAGLGIEAVIVRPGVVYGPGQRPGMLIPALLAALRAGQRFACTPGEQTRDFVHVADVARMIARCAEDDAPAGAYNAGTGVESSVAMVVRALAWRLGRSELVELGALPYRAGEVMRYVLDPSRAKERLRFVAAVALARGLESVADGPQEQVDA
ncbi:NAD-dependent epimerase/dehydratase family protein [Nannocystis radixulma]|uniref:NAD-dependent epimerase/dehydratase family protein n=1 Tax=Nannocystis radixulma TaxID=2995305 RepID=A0ABT5BAG2_9BACT|nr:NAD-dependent epimerase/dehydratase family protein [Nannocystis radixulma]MDC0671119.1 NAD-dependent epimerase/dehydratase family protein [Nannocystis radixulma]